MLNKKAEASPQLASGKTSIGLFSVCKRIFAASTSADKLVYALGILAAIGAGAILPLMTLVFGKFVTVFTDLALQNISSDEFRGQVNRYALYFVYLFVAKFGCTYVYMVSFSTVATNISATIRMQYLHATLHSTISFHETELTTGDVSLALSTHSNTIRAGLAEKFGLSMKSVSTIVAAFVVALTTQWKLALVTATLIPAIVVIVGVPGSFDEKLEKSATAVKAQAATLAEEIFSSARTVRALGAERALSARYENLTDMAIKIGLRRAPLKGLTAGLYMLTLYSGYALAFWYGIKLFAHHEVADSGSIITTLFSIIIAVNGFAELSSYAGSFARVKSAACELFRAMDNSDASRTPMTLKVDVNPFHGDVKFENVTFTYPSRKTAPVLKEFSLTCPVGKTTALVGASGSGKSTVAGLLLRWYEPTQGSLAIGHHDLRSIPVRSLRSEIGVVQQEPCLFTGSVFDNIENGLSGTPLENIPREEKQKLIVQACKTSNAHGFIIRLPNGYDTPIGNRGAMLSGGQKQRLAIARAIVKDPRILVLDEATSALDVTSEAVVQKALDNARVNRTTLIIAHRLSTIKAADQIVVMCGGSVSEIGTHTGLLLKDVGVYRDLWQAQSLNRSNTEPQTAPDTDDELHAVVKQENLEDNTNNSHSQEVTDNFGSWRLIGMILKKHQAYWGIFLILAASAVVGGSLFPLQAYLYSKVISIFQLTGHTLVSNGDFWSLMWFVLAIAVGVGYLGIGWAGALLAEIIGGSYRLDYFKSMIQQNIGFFDRSENSADNLVVRLSADPDALTALVGDNFGVLGTVAVAMVSTVALALAVGWKLGLVVVFGGLPFIFGAGVIRERMEQSFEKVATDMFSDSVAYAGECIQAIRTISSLNMETAVENRFRALTNEYRERSVRASLKSMVWFAFSESIEFLCMALAFWYGGRLLSVHEYNNTQFFIVFIAIVFGSQSAGQFFAHGSDISKGLVSASAIQHLIQQTPKSEGAELPAPDIYHLSSTIPLIEFRNVAFAYPSRPTQKVLDKFSMKIYAGESVALVGASGSGKSTIIQLLERFYDPSEGEILVAGTPITEYSSEGLRETLTLVSQEPVLYQGTIEENILLGCAKQHLDHDRFTKVLAESQLVDLVSSLPDGIRTIVGSKGSQLSGGQKQRVAIARALATGSPVLLLDEATSALDSESERLIQNAIGDTLHTKTVIAVAHRLSTIQHFDHILVLEEGQLVEKGTHCQLLEKKGQYWSMVQWQS